MIQNTPRLLILGGTTEATALAHHLSKKSPISAIISLAGRTKSPALPPIPYRIGGFGGIDGLCDYIAHEKISAIIDATHPFASIMSRNAFEACSRLDIPRLTLTRPAWRASAGDNWITVTDADAAALAIGKSPRNVFLTVGRLSLNSFTQAPQHRYVIRTIDEPDPASLPPHARLIFARGPFTVSDEQRLLETEKISVLITKNSGGTATDAKLLAARYLQIPVIMIDRPADLSGEIVHSLDEAMFWLNAHGFRP